MKCIRNLIPLFLILGSGGLLAQAPDILWQSSIGGSNAEVATDVIALESGNLLVCGSTLSADGNVPENNGSHDVWLTEFNTSGSIEWSQVFGGTSGDIPSAIIQTADGGFLILSTTGSNDGDVAGMHGETDVWLLKMDADRVVEWQHCYGGSLVEMAADVIENEIGYIFSATSYSIDGDIEENHGTLGDYWIVQVDYEGNILWENTYGGTGLEWAHAMVLTQDGQLVVAGESASSDGDITMHKSALDGWVIKIAMDDGDLLWETSVGKFKDDHIADITEDIKGNLIFVGRTQSAFNGYHGYVDLWVGMLRPNGYEKKVKVFGGTHPDYGFSIEALSTGGFLICGYTSSKNGDVSVKIGTNDVWLLQLDEQANLVWEKTYGGTQLDFGVGAITTSDGMVFCATSYSMDVDCTSNQGMSDIWLVRLEEESLIKNSGIQNPAEIFVFPIPASSSFSIALPIAEAGQHCQVIIYDRQGRLCRHLFLTADAGGRVHVDITPGLEAGNYFLLVKSGSGEFVHQIVITGM